MALEIERRFLIKNDNWKEFINKKIYIEQGYLSDTLEDVINNTKIFDIHTHLFPSAFKSHSLSGFINLLNFFKKFYSLSK